MLYEQSQNNAPTDNNVSKNKVELRHARLVEGLGDFIRFMIIGQLQNPYATISVHVLPAASEQRLGGRQTSNLH
jgi:hypothetical protein